MESRERPQLLEVAFDCARRGDFRGVAEVCRGILAKEPDQPDALHCMGLLYRRTGNLDAAVDSHERSVRGQPDNAEYLNALGLAYRAADRMADAIDAYQTALQIAPDFIDAYVNLGQAHLDRGELRPAIARFRDAVERRPGQAHLHVMLGRALLAQGDRTAAEIAYRRALTLDPGDGAAHAAIGELQLLAGNNRAALVAFRDGIEADPEDAGNYLRIAPLLVALGELDSAIDLVRRGAETSPGNPALHAALGRLLLRAEIWDEGWRCYDRRLRIPPLSNERHRFGQPLWDGRDPGGHMICVNFETDVGESLALLRYLEPLLDRGARVALRCPAIVRRLLAPLADRIVLCGPGDAMPQCEFQTWLGSLPLLLEIPNPGSLPTAPAGFGARADAARWAERCVSLARPVVGLHWCRPGNARSFQNPGILLSTFATYERGLIGLQDRTAANEITETGMNGHMLLVGQTLAADGDIMAELAGAITQCDLVVTVDSPVAQLAAMLGRPTLLLLDGGEEFYWPTDRAQTAWSDCVSLMRRQGDDDATFAARVQSMIEAVFGIVGEA